MLLQLVYNTSLIRSLFPLARPILAASCFLLFIHHVPLAQPAATKQPDRRKEFGKSLKRFESKSKPAPSGREPSDTTEEGVIKIATDLVVTDVLVVNQKGNAILGLRKDDFVVTENGVAQELELFAPGDESSIPRKIVLIIEVGDIPTVAESSLEAAKKLVEKLRPIDRMAIADTNVKLRVDFTSDKELLKSSLDSLKRESKAGHHGYSTLMAALNELFNAEDKRQIIIQQSFGDELGMMRPTMWDAAKRACRRGHSDYCERNFSLSDVREVVARTKATIYTVVPGQQVAGVSRERQVAAVNLYHDRLLNERPVPLRYSEQERIEFKKRFTDSTINDFTATQTALVEMSGLAGGYTSFLETPEDAGPVYDGIVRVIENRYTLGFYPRDQKRDGRMRQVKIQVRGHPEYIVIGRGTYFPQ